jgi:hypothetical protein
LKTSKPPVIKRHQDLAHSIEIIKAGYDIPKANKEKIFHLPGKELSNVLAYFYTLCYIKFEILFRKYLASPLHLKKLMAVLQ